MGWWFLLEFLEDGMFLWLLDSFSDLICKQVKQSRVDFIHHQIDIAAERFFVLRHGNVCRPRPVSRGNTPISVFM